MRRQLVQEKREEEKGREGSKPCSPVAHTPGVGPWCSTRLAPPKKREQEASKPCPASPFWTMSLVRYQSPRFSAPCTQHAQHARRPFVKQQHAQRPFAIQQHPQHPSWASCTLTLACRPSPAVHPWKRKHTGPAAGVQPASQPSSSPDVIPLSALHPSMSESPCPSRLGMA